MCIELKDIMREILVHFGGSLYNYALTKMVYLVDVEAVSTYGRQVTSINWQRDNYGPFVWDIIDCAQEHGDIFGVHHEPWNKRQIYLQNMSKPLFQGFGEIDITALVDKVARQAPDPRSNPQAFKDYVYSTAPMVLSRGNGPLNIRDSVAAAKEVDFFTDELFSDESWNEAFQYLAVN